jgi:hypothetical protein
MMDRNIEQDHRELILSGIAGMAASIAWMIGDSRYLLN